MSEIKHTPGPWGFIDATKVAGMQFASKCIIKAEKKLIADFSWNDNSQWFPTKEESQANALLIAAAPELLEALKFAGPQLEVLHQHYSGADAAAIYKVIGMVKSAIAKAEGRS